MLVRRFTLLVLGQVCKFSLEHEDEGDDDEDNATNHSVIS